MDLDGHIHKCRTYLLNKLPKANIILSLGCAGKWYFDWFDKNYKFKVIKHIGIDLNDKPSDLTNNVEWIQGDGADLSPIKSNSIDLIFAGQFIEHIDYLKQAKLIYQANRILKDKKTFVLDSPNFSIVNRFGWKQPQHIRELSYDQIVNALKILKFKVKNSYGVIPKQLVVNTPKIENKLFLNSNFSFELYDYKMESSISKKTSDCFIWWIVATKESNASENDFIKASTYLKKINLLNIKTTNKIIFHQIGKLVNRNNPTINIGNKEVGFALYGPYLTVMPGTYEVKFNVKTLTTNSLNENSIVLDISTDAGNTVLAKNNIKKTTAGKQTTHTLSFNIEIESILEFRVFSFGKVQFEIGANPEIKKIK